MKLTQIRSLGFAWPSSAAMSTSMPRWRHCARTRFYQRELHDMHAFQREHNADWNDVSDNRAEYNEKSAELRAAIKLVEAIKAKVP